MSVVPEGTPRRTVEPDPIANLMRIVSDLRKDVSALQRGSTLRNASVSGGNGLRVLDEDGKVLVALVTSDGGGVIAYDENGQAVARFGPLVNSSPDEYGVEILVNGTWVRLGYQDTIWTSIAGRPGVSGGAHIPASFIDGAIADAQYAATANYANTAETANSAGVSAQANGSQYGWTNNVAGTSFYAVWVGNDGGYHFGRNVSSRKYKENIKDWEVDKRILDARPVTYDRKAAPIPLGEGEVGPKVMGAGAKNEFGLIAEEVFEILPEVVQYFEGDIDGLRYELITVALIPIVKEHEDKIGSLEAAVRRQQVELQELRSMIQEIKDGKQ